jgi:hypothetical protein
MNEPRLTALRLWLAVSMAAACAAAASDELKEAPRSIHVAAPIDVAADGHAEIGEIEGVSPQLAQVARTSLARQRYLPAYRAGVPVASRSRVEATLELAPAGERFEVSLGSVWVGPRVRHFLLPDYPPDMARLGKEDVFLLRIQAGPERRAISSALASPTERAFEQAAIRAVRDWRFDQLLIDGKPVSYEVIQPFWFHRYAGNPAVPELQCPPVDSTPRGRDQKNCLEYVEIYYWSCRSDQHSTIHRAGSRHDCQEPPR